MRKFLALCAILVLAAPAPAHFIWLLPHGDRGTDPSALMIFSDTLEPDANVPVNKIGGTKLFARSGPRGELQAVKIEDAKDAYRVLPGLAGDGAALVAGTCTYGVVTRGKTEPFLLMYYPKTIVRKGAAPRVDWIFEATEQLPLEIIPVNGKKALMKVLWRGQPAADAEVTLYVPGIKEPVTAQTDATGVFGMAEPKAGGIYGMRCKIIENRAGALDGKKYQQVHHHATFTLEIPARFVPREKKEQEVLFIDEASKPAADPAATKLLAEARTARAVWNNFPGFRAAVEVNVNGQIFPGKVEVTAQGKVALTLSTEGLVSTPEEIKTWARREIASLVAHRMPGGPQDTPCAFADESTTHPLGRLIRVLNDELHSSYRIRDREIVEVNRTMKESRFSITVLESTKNKEGHYLPACYVVNSWDLAGKTLLSSMSHRQSWSRVGSLDVPRSLLVVTATPGKLDSRSLTFTSVEVMKDGARAGQE